MKILITLCFSLITSMQFVQAEAVVIGNNSAVDFSSLSSDSSETELNVENQSINGMILGNITALISSVEWTDTQMADYQQRYGSNPHQLVIAAFDNRTENRSEPTATSQSIVNTSTAEATTTPTTSTTTKADEVNVTDNSKEKEELSSQALAEIFSTRDGSTLLYLYISEFESDKTRNDIALFFSEDAQAWFTDQGLIAIPDSVQQQNLVTLGLKEPMFQGGYK